MEFIIDTDIKAGGPLGNCVISPAEIERREEVVFKWSIMILQKDPIIQNFIGFQDEQKRQINFSQLSFRVLFPLYASFYGQSKNAQFNEIIHLIQESDQQIGKLLSGLQFLY